MSIRVSSKIESLRGAIAATALVTTTRYSWFGSPSADVQDHVRPLLQVRLDAARAHLVGTLTNRLYEDFYQPGRARPTPSPYAGSTRANGLPELVDEIAAANAGTGTRQSGWVITEHRESDDGNTELAIQRDGLMLRAKPDEIVYAGNGPPKIGDEVELKLPKELPAISPGFYTALSNAPFEADGREVVRFYWNLYPWGAPTLTREITRRLNDAGLPFRLKLVNHPDRYTCCDAAVLYLFKEDLDATVPLLEKVYADVRDDLKRPVPALTKCIAPGLGLAEDPHDGDSYGMSRCRLLAEGLVRGWERGAESVEERLEVVLETFREAGVDPERPYLNPGSDDVYDFTIDVEKPETPDPGVSTGWVDVAREIGREICEEAFWHEGWCNWLGVEPRDPNAPAHQGTTYASLGPEPYGGSSGVALFLAELAVATGDEKARETALGAIRQALGRAAVIEPPVQLGLYTGRLGVALVARRVGRLLDADDVERDARALLDGIDSDLEGNHEHDLLSGAAGGIVALLRVSELLDDDSLVARARELGDRLVATATCDELGCSWPSVVSPEMPNLTGLSHGAAGIGMALLELWHVTGEQMYRDVAERAFDFEQSWFNPDEGNWPDFRPVESLADRPNGPFPYATAWCHGAPGIALSRLRAWELTGDDRYRDEAVVALETTRRSVVEALEDGTMNYSLCHGLAGNAEILMLGAELLGAGFDHLASTAKHVADAGIRIYAPEGRSWPCGAHGGWTPNLMLGLAGIGRFYLRMADPTLPSLLIWPSTS